MSFHPRLKWLLTEPRTLPVSPNPKDEEWNDHAGMSGPVNGLDASWTATSGGLQSIAYGNGRAIVTVTGGATPGLAGYVKTQPSTPYTVTCELALDRHTSFNEASIGFFDGTKFWVGQLYQDNVTSVDEYRRVGFTTWRYSNLNTRTSSGNGYVIASRSVWMQVTNDGANLSWGWSPTGVAGTFETVQTDSYAAALLTPTHFFIGADALSLITAVCEFGPVRVT